MQPTLVITAPVEGMVSINGRFAGETRPDAPLFAPVAPFGPVWIEYRPLAPGFLPMARKLVLSNGTPLAESMGEGLFATLWPGGVSEIELSPERIPEQSVEAIVLDGLALRIFRGAATRLEVGSLSVDLPERTVLTQLHRTGSALLLTGTCGERQLLLALSPDADRQTGMLLADRIRFESPGVIRSADLCGDVAGHAVQTRWQADGAGLHRISTENIWEDGIPRRPATPEETARALAEATLLEFCDEAGSYLLPGAQPSVSPEAVSELGSLCLPMKYSAAAPSVALLRLEEENLARAVPLYYRAEFFGNEWRIADLWT